MADFDPKDFEALMLRDILNLSDNEDALEKYPILKKHKAFNVQLPHYNRILKYIAFAYDKNTPFHVISDVMSRKSESMKLAGLKRDFELYEQCVFASDDRIAGMIMWYVRLHKNLDYTDYIVAYESYYNQQQKMLQDSVGDGEKTKDFIANTRNLRSEIDRLRLVLFNNDKSSDLTNKLDTIVEEELQLSPEHIAKMSKKDAREYLENN